MVKSRGVNILSFEAKDLYNANIHGRDYTVRYPDGNINFKKYRNTLDYSLDLIKMREEHYKAYRSKSFSFVDPNRSKKLPLKEYSNQVINVTFEYSHKEYNKAVKDIYVKDGYFLKDLTLTDSICIINGEITAIEVNKVVNENKLKDIVASKNFYFNPETQKYEQVGAIKTLMGVKELRRYLYDEGFTVDGISYVRYKRSSGSARVGKCLFINRDIYNRMHRWDTCGLKVVPGKEIDLAAFEAAVSLSLSSIIDTIKIEPEEILMVDDYDSVFEDDVIAVDFNGDSLTSEAKRVTITNSIWDGQALLDKSVFADKYHDKSFLLLRNRYFKTCGFNTDIQLWFADNNITKVEQLNGFTLAKDISQIKMITTPNSLKYLKFGTLQEWLDNIEPIFGIVKYDKPTHYFNGRMVKLHYQLLNTLQLSYKEMEEFLQPSLDYINMIYNDPTVLRYHIKHQIQDDEDREYTTKNDVIFNLLGLNENFTQTKMYYEFRNDLGRSMIADINRGHVLAEGTYATMFSNGIEMLKSAIGKFDGSISIERNSIYCKRFKDGEEIIGTRSPHIISSNVFLTINKKYKEVDKYFKLNKEIVYINSVNDNIMQRLNGADFDSDTMGLTNNKMLVDATKKNYDKFLVPTCLVQSSKLKRIYSNEEQCNLDIKSSVNKIGEIVNLSQVLNSLFWENIYNGQSVGDNEQLYLDICKLAVLSGLEIDAVKREVLVNTDKELKAIRDKYVQKNTYNKQIKPNFFKMIYEENGYTETPGVTYRRFETPMDYLQDIVGKWVKYNTRKSKNSVPFYTILRNMDAGSFWNSHHITRNFIINKLREYRQAVKDLNNSFNDIEYIKVEANRLKENIVSYVSGLNLSNEVGYLLLKAIDDKDFKDLKKTLFNILFLSSNKTFYKILKKNRTSLPILEEINDGEIQIFNMKFTKNIQKT